MVVRVDFGKPLPVAAAAFGTAGKKFRENRFALGADQHRFLAVFLQAAFFLQGVNGLIQLGNGIFMGEFYESHALSPLNVPELGCF